MPGTLGKDAIEVGAGAWRAWVFLVAFDLSLPAMGAAQGLLSWMSVTGAGAQCSPGDRVRYVVCHEGRTVCLKQQRAYLRRYKIPGTQENDLLRVRIG